MCNHYDSVMMVTMVSTNRTLLKRETIIIRAGGMSSQLVWPNLTMRTMQLNEWVVDNFMNIEILFLILIL